jgi:CBS domain containing-hemolysin-like protein
MNVKEALDFAIKEGYSRYPVFDGTIDEILGVINTKDLMKNHIEGKSQMSIKPLIRPAYFVPDNRKIKDLLKSLQTKRAVMAIVTDEIGEVSGIVTLEDILEELVGEIQDEYDDEKPYVQQTSPDTFVIDAHRKLGDINKYLPYRLEEDDEYETLSGYLAYHFPENFHKGSKLQINDYEVTILTMYRNSVATVEFRLLKNEEKDK